MNRSGYGSSDWIMGAVKRNPEGLLLLAAGCALLMRSGSSPGAMFSGSNSNGYRSRPEHSLRQTPEEEWRDRKSVASSTGSAREYAADVGRSVSETASEYASAVGGYADEAKRTILEGSGRLAEQAQTTMQRTVDSVLREQPLAVALAGLAAGALVAAAFPTSSLERDTLGAAGERLSDAATKTGKQLQEAAAAAGDRLMEAAEERGLTSGGLKEVAGEVAGAFGESFSGDKQDKTSSSLQTGKLSSSSGNQSGSSSSGGSSGLQPGSSSASGSQGSKTGSASSGTSSSGTSSGSGGSRAAGTGTSSGGAGSTSRPSKLS